MHQISKPVWPVDVVGNGQMGQHLQVFHQQPTPLPCQPVPGGLFVLGNQQTGVRNCVTRRNIDNARKKIQMSGQNNTIGFGRGKIYRQEKICCQEKYRRIMPEWTIH